MIDIDKLEALAKAATPGPWTDDSKHPDHLYGAINKENKHIALCNHYESGEPTTTVTGEEMLANAAFIAAANPAAILELIVAYRSLERHRQKFHKERSILATLLSSYGREYYFCPPDLADYQADCPGRATGRASTMGECQRCWINFAQRDRDCIQS